MKMLEEKIKNCKTCGDFSKPKCESFVVGNSNVLIVGEAPAKNGWLVSGKAFYDVNGKLQGSGKILNKLLNLSGLALEDISFTECCKCHIADRKILDSCAQNCRGYLLEQICNSDCTLILTMGVIPSQVLLNCKIKQFKDYVGKSFEIDANGISKTVIPIYHPSPVNPLGFKGNIEIFESLKKFV